jgi:hypothetical protein
VGALKLIGRSVPVTGACVPPVERFTGFARFSFGRWEGPQFFKENVDA